jgi:hypothetical protein
MESVPFENKNEEIPKKFEDIKNGNLTSFLAFNFAQVKPIEMFLFNKTIMIVWI